METAIKVTAFVIPLGLDTFAVAIALGLRGARPLRLAVLFAAFETIMPLFGIAVGVYVGRRFETLAALLGGVILVAIGLNTLRETLRGDDDTTSLNLGSVRGSVLAGLGISMDELAVGFPMAVVGLPIAVILAAIAAQAFLVTVLGIVVGGRIGAALGMRAAEWAGFAGGAAFVALGLSLLATQLLR